MADEALYENFKKKCTSPENHFDKNQLETLFQQLLNNLTVKSEQLEKTERELASSDEKIAEMTRTLRKIEEENGKLNVEIEIIRRQPNEKRRSVKENEEKRNKLMAENENSRILVRQQEAEMTQLTTTRKNLREKLQNDELSLKNDMENAKISTEYAAKLTTNLSKQSAENAEIFRLYQQLNSENATVNSARLEEIRKRNDETREKLIELHAKREILRNFLEIRDVDTLSSQLFLAEMAKSRIYFQERAQAQQSTLEHFEKLIETEKSNEEKLRGLVDYYMKKYESNMDEEIEDVIEATQ